MPDLHPPTNRPPWIADARRHPLPSGALWIADLGAPSRGGQSVHGLCDFAARRNPRRGFLFVSTVLGRYLPVVPARLDGVLRRLADRLPADLPGPVLFVGVAAAGVAIGHRVWARYLDRTGRQDTVFVTSTRHRFDAPLAYGFDEPHSHAPRHRLHRPLDPEAAARFAEARSVVIVDDEVTSGRTVTGLIARHHRHHPGARRFVHAVLTDWTTEALDRSAPPGCTVDLVAEARGAYHFEPDPHYRPCMPDVTGDADPRWHRAAPGHGRFGRLTPLVAHDLPLARLPAIEPGQRILVLGSGESQYPAFLLAEHLTAAGADARYQCTVRAPVSPGGPISKVLRFADARGEGIPNFLYNVAPADFDLVLYCQEPGCHPPPTLIEALNARVFPLDPVGAAP